MKRSVMQYAMLLSVLTTLTACGNAVDVNNDITVDISQEEETTPVTVPSFSTTTAPIIATGATETTAIMTSVVTESTTTNVTEATTQPEFSETASVTTIATEPIMTTTEVNKEEVAKKQQQENSLAWLNYLAMLSQEINSSKNSKMYLEEAYAALINNTNPANVNELTESHLVSMLDIIERYRMIAVKRERLQYIYEQNKAKAIKEAVPNPISVLSAASSLDPKRLAVSVIYMAIDSYNSYTSYNNELDQEFLKDGWELDDEAAENLHDSRKRAFTYMIETVREEKMPGELALLALNENDIEKFVECKNNSNTYQQIQFLESKKSVYKAFGSYWLLLAECYYKNNEYQKCIDSIKEYEGLHATIYRKDTGLAQVLPFVLASASEVQSKNDYKKTAEKYLKSLVDNTNDDDWALRYYAAEMYLDLYVRFKNEKYLQSAYAISKDNVNYLIKKQEGLNQTYLSEVKEVTVPDTATKKEQKQAKEYNKSLKEKRKTELPEIYEPLALNCDLLFTVADKLKISQSEKDSISGLLVGSGTDVFLTKSVKNAFSFKPSKISAAAEFNKDEFVLPVYCVSEGADIKVTVSNGNEQVVYDDWKVEKVERSGSNINSFKAFYKSKKASDCKWSKDSTVRIEIRNGDYSKSEPLVIRFKISKYKERKVGWTTVEFAQVE